ncbi:MAG: folylpolyglutamate synthase/dihydrofolate synthase family protein [Planctomycetota bacterium]
MSYEDALRYLYDRIDYERARDRSTHHEFRLQRTIELFERLGLGDYLHRGPTPDRESRSPPVPLIHLAGTKGKGSTAAMASSILASAGNRVGCYTSPHLTNLEERFRIDGVPCDAEELVELVETVRPVVDRIDADSTVSFFELTTAMAMLHFSRKQCDAIVLEVGLGGRLDSTNVCASSVAAITSIGLDHQRVLGQTRPEIAAEKSGIIKSPAPVVSGVEDAASVAVINAAADRAGAPFYQVGAAYRIQMLEALQQGSRFRFHAEDGSLCGDDSARDLDIRIGLEGAHQVRNAAVAIAATRLLRDSRPIDDTAIVEGLARVSCPGRVERFRLGEGRAVIVDTAHNEDSIEALCETLRTGVAIGALNAPVVVLFASSRDKDVGCMAKPLSALADEVICTQFSDPPRYVAAATVAEYFRAAGASRLATEPRARSALRIGRDRIADGGTLVICGSFFLAGELRPEIEAVSMETSIEAIAVGRIR